ncbi:hypothetical protein [Hafnia paralvei]|uniref:hypothetical protein n=1 Tax=Hafnia paralvei TaxID=546367 RepID=UPI0007E4C388|nr:hypothetical protein [Hafnia paralvei]HCU15724.1 hypothetical protein [Hafnia paralvei]
MEKTELIDPLLGSGTADISSRLALPMLFFWQSKEWPSAFHQESVFLSVLADTPILQTVSPYEF